ncbi:MAG: iron-containing alcohol dehydrogenase family protein [Christensenellales bacterium]|jgi:alcohol dehydrogenase class IV
MSNVFYCPVKVVYGKGCVSEHSSLLSALGKRALIVTAPSSAKNGSREDVIAALEKEGMGYAIYDRCENNPSLQMVDNLGAFARASGCDLVIGVGGGSPMDCAKAASVLATNDYPASELFKNVYPNRPLPLILIPTTAGTGSEMSYNSVLTVDGGTNKKSFGTAELHAKLAFLDATYTEKLPMHLARHTAVDAFAHALEGFLKPSCSTMGALFAKEVFRVFAQCRDALLGDSLDFETREKLLMNSMLAGIVIAQERTIGLHVASYPLTAMYGVHHGLAVGLPMAAFVKMNYAEAKEKIDEVLHILGLSSPDELKDYLGALLSDKNTYTMEDVEKMMAISVPGIMARENPHKFTEEEVRQLYLESLNMV